MGDHLIDAGYLPCMTKTTCESRIVSKRFIPMKDEKISYETDDESSDDENSSSSDDEHVERQSGKQKYSIIAAAISRYVADIKGL